MTDTTAAHERYERHELLQPGAVETWSGLDRTLNRPVTIRRAAADSEIGHRLRLQAKSLARVEHHGLLHILDTYDEAEHFAIVTEQLPTRILVDELAAPDGQPRRLAAEEAIRIVIAVTEPLAALHSAGFAHGGVDADCIGWRAEVGWVILNGPPTDDAVIIPATRRADVVSLAVLAHRLIAGASPQRHSDGTWELDPIVPDVVAPVLARAMSASDPWPDMGSMLLALRSVVDDLPTPGTVRPDRRSTWQAERHWMAPGGVLLAVAATLVGIALIIEQPEGPGAPTSAPVQTSSPSQSDTESDSAPAISVTRGTDTESPTTDTVFTPQAELPASTTTLPRRTPVPLASVTDFDPAGDDRVEHPERLIFINDGDATTGWSTARYSTRDFGGLKDGVGLIIMLAGDDLNPVERLSIDSPTVGWSFEVYASDERNRTVIDWGQPVAVAQDVIGSTTVDLPATPAAALLVWITDLGNELASGGHRVTISRIEPSNSLGDVLAPPSTDAVTP